MASSIRPVVFCGPSGAGKSTLLKRLMKEHPKAFAFSVSHTTRSPRPGEQNGREYHFVSRDEMTKLIDDNQFLEHAQFSGTKPIKFILLPNNTSMIFEMKSKRTHRNAY